jgi:hypothetical protein
MADESLSDERKEYIDAARESARTFDKAALTFGSAVFGFSIAFLKDIAPTPAPETLKWLGTSWVLFSFGLLAILLSFLFSHRACLFEIEVGEKTMGNKDFKRERNLWSKATNWCNIGCVVFLFLGLLCWSKFALDNLEHGDTQMNKVLIPTEKKGYVPPPSSVKAPSQQQAPTPPAALPTTQSVPKK